MCGSALHGKLGIPDLQATHLSKFIRIPEPKKFVTQVACGDYHNLALTEDGVVYTWGGSLHKKASGGNIPHPVQSLIDEKAYII